ncbi:MAG: tetratricopeptide repeat protein [Treponema sp.]|nr:tetratricopeptide repeat protein [Treponema sp.]
MKYAGSTHPICYILLLLVFLAMFFFLIPSCASTSSGTARPSETAASGDGPSGDTTEIAVPAAASRSYFRKISPDVLSDIEFGSPLSLRRAAGNLRKTASDYTEPEKVLLSVAAGITTIAWPSVSITWETPEVVEPTSYLGALDSAQLGVYDYSTGDIDFLTLELPSLVLLSSGTRTDYYNTARTALKKALALNPDSLLANYLYGILLRRMGQDSEALVFLKKAADSEKNCLETNYALAKCYQATGAVSAAESAAQNLELQYPENTDVIKLCAETTFAAGHYDSAEQYVARVLQKQPDNTTYILFRARILVQKKDYIRAAALLDVYARTDQDSRDYLMLRAQIQRDWNRNDDAAMDTIKKAIALYPDDMQILLFAADLALSSGTIVDGMDAGQLAFKILAADPDNTEAIYIYVMQKMRDKDWNDAYTYSSRLMTSSGELPADAAFNHIQICLELDKTDEAWELAARLYKERPGDEKVLQSYLLVLTRIGKTAEAYALINQLLPQASSKMKSTLYYRRSFIVSGTEAQLADLRSSLIANPRNSDTLFRMYSIYFKNKDYRKAQYYLRQVIALNPSDESMLKLNTELDSLVAR